VSSANVELVRSIFATWAPGDSSTEWADPEIEWVVADGPDPGTWKGLAAIGDAMRDQLGAWELYRVEAEEFREIDDERVLVLTRNSGRAKTSGIEIGQIKASPSAAHSRRQGDEVRLLPRT
jgi:hypothetical protein